MEQSDLKGKWELISWTHKSIKDNVIHFPFGMRPKGHMEFSENKFMSFAHKNFKAMESSVKINSPLYDVAVSEISTSGSYELMGNKIMLHYEESSMPSLIQQNRERAIWFDGHQTMVISGNMMVEGQEYSTHATFIRVV